MRVRFVVAVSLLAASKAVAQTPPAFPPGAEAREAQLMMRVGPQTRAWILQEARREAAMNAVTDTTAIAAAQSYKNLGGIGDGDVMAIAFIVMMESAKSSQEDLKSIMAGVKRINDSKAAMRQANAQNNLNEKRPASESQRSSGSAAASVRPLPQARAATTAIQPPPRPNTAVSVERDRVKDSKDSLSEMGETEQLRLQTAMDRQSKAMQMLSNLLKKISDTGSGITQNLK